MKKLSVPLILAPMAGGVSNPELCAEVARVGGLPFLAAGYLTPQALQMQIQRLEELTAADYGINIFYPSIQTPHDAD